MHPGFRLVSIYSYCIKFKMSEVQNISSEFGETHLWQMIAVTVYCRAVLRGQFKWAKRGWVGKFLCSVLYIENSTA